MLSICANIPCAERAALLDSRRLKLESPGHFIFYVFAFKPAERGTASWTFFFTM